MNDLDQIERFAALDPQDMLGEITGLPQQLQAAWALGQSLELPDWEGIQRILIAGMGGSAIGADLLSAYITPLCRLPVSVQRDYDLPAWAQGPETLVIACSHSGNTEETLSSFEQAVSKQCRILAITTGGKLAARAQANQAELWQFEHAGQPRAAVGYSFGLLLAVFTHLGLVPDPEDELQGAILAMQAQQSQIEINVPVTSNPAKRLAGQCYGRWVAVMGADLLAPVARRWKGQISEIAKAWAQFEFLPEADHNTLAGLVYPETAIQDTMVIFLRGRANHPRNQLRIRFTKEILMLAGLSTDFFDVQANTPLAQLWTALHFGDYLAYYLAMAYGVNPTPVEAIEDLKARLKQAGE